MKKISSMYMCIFFFSSRRRHTRFDCDWSSDVCSSDLKRVSSGVIFKTVHSIAEDSEGYLWFGEWGNGLDRMNPRTGEIKSYRHEPGNQIGRASCRERV